MISYRTLLGIFLAGLMVLSGCESDSVDDDLPPPHLSAPRIDAPPRAVAVQPAPRYAAPQPVAPAAAPARPAPRASASAVPAGWVPPVAPRQWKWIIIHHSASDYGSAAIIDQWHRQRGFDELGYDFVIGNGHGSGDGQIEIGPRWTQQKWGAHDNALDNRYNLYGIGICLVGDFDKTVPTAAQKASLLRLTVYMMRTYHITPDRVLGHGETKDTDCPGKNLRVVAIRAAVAQMLAKGETDTDGTEYALDIDPK